MWNLLWTFLLMYKSLEGYKNTPSPHERKKNVVSANVAAKACYLCNSDTKLCILNLCPKMKCIVCCNIVMGAQVSAPKTLANDHGYSFSVICSWSVPLSRWFGPSARGCVLHGRWYWRGSRQGSSSGRGDVNQLHTRVSFILGHYQKIPLPYRGRYQTVKLTLYTFLLYI